MFLTSKRVCAFFAVMLAFAIAFPLQAQTKPDDKNIGFIEFGTNFSTMKGVTPALQFQLGYERRIHEYCAVGLGAGIMESWKFEGNPLVPIFARFHGEKFSESFSPFVKFDVGYSLNTTDLSYGSVIVNPTLGVRFSCLSLGLGYYGLIPTKSEGKTMNNINLTLGYTFGPDSKLMKVLGKFDFQIDAGVLATIGGNKSFSSEYTYNSYTTTNICDSKQKPGFNVNIGLLYPVNDYLSVGLTAGFITWKDEFSFRYKETDEKGTIVSEGKVMDNYGEEIVKEYSHKYFPIAFRARYKARQLTFAKKLYPFAQLDLGAELSNAAYTHKHQFYYSPMVGLSYDIKGGNQSLDLGIGYVPLNCRHVNIFHSSGDESDNDNNFGALKISLGYSF